MNFFYMGVLVPLMVLVPLFIAFYRYDYLQPPGKIILLYLLLEGVTNIIGRYLAVRKMSNLYVLHVNTCIEFLLICLFFREVFNTARAKKWLLILALVYIVAAVVNSIFLQHISRYNSYALSVSALVVISLCLYYFKVTLFGDTIVNWRTEPVFWFTAGFMIYFSSSLFLFILSNFTFHMSQPLTWILWNIHATMVLIMYLLFARGFFYVKAER